ncbi:hypothetical protein Tco_0581830 [Tanacetum coccineum]
MDISLSSSEVHPPWRFATFIDDIRLWAKNMHFTFSLVKREQNKSTLIDYYDLGTCSHMLDRLFDLKLLEITSHKSSLHHLELPPSGKPAGIAALAVLVTRTSQSRQHGKSESEIRIFQIESPIRVHLHLSNV